MLKNKSQLILEYIEKYGIIDYKIKGNTITYYQYHAIDCFGNKKKYKYTHNIRTNETIAKELYSRK